MFVSCFIALIYTWQIIAAIAVRDGVCGGSSRDQFLPLSLCHDAMHLKYLVAASAIHIIFNYFGFLSLLIACTTFQWQKLEFLVIRSLLHWSMLAACTVGPGTATWLGVFFSQGCRRLLEVLKFYVCFTNYLTCSYRFSLCFPLWLCFKTCRFEASWAFKRLRL